MRPILGRAGLCVDEGGHWQLDWLVLLGGKLLVAGAVLVSGFTSLSGDEVSRTLLAHAWAQKPLLILPEFGEASALWLPLPFWLMGSLLKIWEDLWLVPLIVSLFFTLFALYFLFRIGTLLYDRRTGFLSAALVGILPWNTWLGLSAAAEPLYHAFLLAGFYYFVRWLQIEGRRHLWLASGGFLLAGMARPEAWGFAGIYGLWVLTKTPSVQGSRIGWAERGSAAVLALGFSLVWLGINYAYYGDPLHFLALNLDRDPSIRIESPSLRLLQFPLILFGVSSTLTVLSLWALPWAWNRRSDEAKAYLAVVGGAFCLHILVGFIGLGTGHSPQRFVLVFLSLFSPFIAALILQMLRQRELRSRLVAIALTVFFLGNFTLGFFYVDRYAHVVAAGRYLEKLWTERRLGEGDLVASERAVHLLDGTFAGLPYRDKVSLLIERAFLQLFSGHPDNFIDQDWALEAEVKQSTEARQGVLNQERAKLLVAWSPAVTRRLSNRYRLFCQRGRYLFFGEQGFEAPCPAPHYPRPVTLKNVTLGGLYDVDRYTLHPTTLPSSVLIWLRPVSRDLPDSRVLLRAEGQGGFYQEILPLYVLKSEALLVFPLQSELPPGTYRLHLTLLPVKGAGDPGRVEPARQEVTLGPVTLIASKREAAKALLKSWRFEPEVLLRLFLTF